MGFVRKTPSGSFRACWRDPSGSQKSKSFRTKKEASAFLAEVEGSLNRGAYIDPHAGRVRFRDFAARWMVSRDVEARTAERTLSLMRTHLIPKWGDWPVSTIDYMAVQEWVSELGRSLAPGTVAKCHGVLLMVLRTAVRARLIAQNPAEGVRIPGAHKPQAKPVGLSREQFFGKLLPALPVGHRAIVCAAAGAGLRWGECAGLPWGAIDFDHLVLRVVQVAVETPTQITIRPYPKSRAGFRVIPMPAFLVDALRAHRARATEGTGSRDLVFSNEIGAPLRRSNFRRRIWLPALVRAGLAGEVVQAGHHRFYAVWRDREGIEWKAEFTTEREVITHVAAHVQRAPRFHDLRHSYATWLVTDGVPINIVQKVMGHEQASTTLDRYTHTPTDYADRVRDAFNASDASLLPETPKPGSQIDEEEGGDVP